MDKAAGAKADVPDRIWCTGLFIAGLLRAWTLFSGKYHSNVIIPIDII